MTSEVPVMTWGVGEKQGSAIEDLILPWSKFIPLKPTPKQLAFLLLPCLEALYGGAGGGGKSIALLMAALQYVDLPGYAALIIRKTFADLSLPSALIDVANSWLMNSGAKWSDTEKTWKFPSSATLTFGYIDSSKDKYRYQSAAFQYIGFDEVTQFEMLDYTFMFSRLRRSIESTVPLRMRCASNPGNIGHQWVKDRFMAEGSGRIFLPARIKDNPHIDHALYHASLAELDPITRLQIEEGDWSARHAGNKFQREWFEIVDVAPAECRKVRFWDMAATEPKKGRDPDWTVGLLLGLTPDNMLYLIDVQRVRATPHATEKLITQMAELDTKQTPIRMEQEPGASGITAIDDYKRRVLMGWDFKGVSSTGSKEVRANPVASQAEAGNIKLVRGPWNAIFLDETELFPAGSHDDQVDALSGALADMVGVGKTFMVG